jgi:hypothetical protein
MRKKKKITQKEILQDFIGRANKTIGRANKTIANMHRSFQHFQEANKKITEENQEAILHLQKEFLLHTELLKEITRINANVDESLGNVLLAIRQNEFLQAYYPAQLGYPEMKIVGTHPAKLEKKVAL